MEAFLFDILRKADQTDSKSQFLTSRDVWMVLVLDMSGSIPYTDDQLGIDLPKIRMYLRPSTEAKEAQWSV